MGHRFIVAMGFCAAAGLATNCAADLERSLAYADSLERSAERLREHGHVQNAEALEREAQRHRKATLSSSLLPMAMIKLLFGEPVVERPVGFAGPIKEDAPVSSRF